MRARALFLFSVGWAALVPLAFAQGPPDRGQVKLGNLPNLLAGASRPARLFALPTSAVLRSFEVSLSAGSSYGVANGGGTVARASFGLGGVAEVEFSSAEVANQMSGQTTRLPTRAFKMGLTPEWLRGRWYVPDVALQLCTSNWGELMRRGDYVAPDSRRMDAQGWRLTTAALESRATTLYLVLGKQGAVAGVHVGLCLADVRTRRGIQWLYNEATYTTTAVEIPELQKNILGPAGGLTVAMNPRTHLMVEAGPVPEIRYLVEERAVAVRRVWRAVGGVRFFLGSWLSWDTGVRYQSNFAGIADARIEMSLNMILPLRRTRA
ncbi:MAG: hypothetical protein H5U38_04690 [Calditrichaeota bacterium]|nr:hypothetical protein [Calditrichota bacterium]